MKNQLLLFPAVKKSTGPTM